MVNLVFVVDTSASMNQRTSLGTTLLDVAKNAVETFIKVKESQFYGLGPINGR
jgi:Mg-chelatase subunit ChlD